jgi:ATP synthase protein I
METGGPKDSFEGRLQAARVKQGLDTPPKPTGESSTGSGASPWGIGLRLGVEMVSALVVAVAIGYGLDRAFGTKPWLMLAFLPLGMVAGVLNVWRSFGRQDQDGGTSSGGRGT